MRAIFPAPSSNEQPRDLLPSPELNRVLGGGVPDLRYTPAFCVSGNVSFDFEVTEDATSDTGTIDITIVDQENAAAVGRSEVCGQ